MYSLLFLSALACLLSLALTPLLRGLARRRGWLDCPDGGRKFHTRAVPRVGGVAVALSYLLAFVIWLALPLNATALIQGHLALAFRLLPVAALLLAIGLADDLRGLSPLQKLAGQTIAAALACGAGVRVTTLADMPIGGPLSVALTLAWLLMCTNAYNLIDGMDGLAAGVGLLASLTMLLASLLQGSVPLALATAPLAGALLGFLRYNRAPASIFLGDSGSLTVGFLLGCYGVLWTQKCATLLGLAAPVMALALPLVEIALSVGRRFLKGEPIFRADHDHIHHRLLRLGFSPRKAVFILYAAAAVAAGLSLLQSVGGRGVEGLALVLFCAFVWVAVQSLGYVEFGAASRLVLHGGCGAPFIPRSPWKSSGTRWTTPSRLDSAGRSSNGQRPHSALRTSSCACWARAFQRVPARRTPLCGWSGFPSGAPTTCASAGAAPKASIAWRRLLSPRPSPPRFLARGKAWRSSR